MENVSEYEREHLYPILEQTIIPEFRERRTESSRSDYNVQRTVDAFGSRPARSSTVPMEVLQSSHTKPSAPSYPPNKIDLFLLEKKKLDEKLIHYKKIKNRWTTADSSIKIACISITGILTIATSVMSGLTLIALVPTTGIILTSILGGFNAVYLFLSEGISIGLTSKKKKIYREVCEQLELGINKLYLFQMKALEDNILTSDEIIECQKIIQEINEKINKIKYGSNIEKDLLKEINKEKIEKKKLIKLEYRDRLKNLV